MPNIYLAADGTWSLRPKARLHRQVTDQVWEEVVGDFDHMANIIAILAAEERGDRVECERLVALGVAAEDASFGAVELMERSIAAAPTEEPD